MDSYIGNRPLNQAAGYRTEVVATAGQTDFPVSYAPGYIDVFMNGVKLGLDDFTATDGAEIVLASGATAGDLVAFIAWAKGTMVPVDDYYTRGEADANFAPITRSRKNLLINGSFAVAQRGKGPFSVSGSVTYVVDRWWCVAAGANLQAYQIDYYSQKHQHGLVVAGAAGNTRCDIAQRIEGANTEHLANKTVTCSGQAFSTDGVTVTWEAYYADSRDVWASKTLIDTGTFSTNPASYTDFQFSFLVPSGFAHHGIEVRFKFGALVATKQAGLRGVQLEEGEEATEFEFRPFGEELALCQRYYETGNSHGIMGVYDASAAYSQRRFFATGKRAVPTMTITNYVAWLSASWVAWPGTTIVYAATDGFALSHSGASGLTLRCNPEAYTWTADAEL